MPLIASLVKNPSSGFSVSRERPEDIAPLARHFLNTLAVKSHKTSLKLTADDIRVLQRYSFPGNVRELQNIIERAVIMAQSNRLNFSLSQIIDRLIDIDTGPAADSIKAHKRIKNYEELKEFERENLISALRETNYKIYSTDGAAHLLRIKPTTLVSRIKAMKIPVRP
jgi:transcriptional regulator with GAF, ATPase, and Fis domain